MKLEVFETESGIQVDAILLSSQIDHLFSYLPEYFFRSYSRNSSCSYTFRLPVSIINAHLPFGEKPLTWIWNSFIDAFYQAISNSVY